MYSMSTELLTKQGEMDVACGPQCTVSSKHERQAHTWARRQLQIRVHPSQDLARRGVCTVRSSAVVSEPTVNPRHSPRAPGGWGPPQLTGRPCRRAGTSTRSRRARRGAARAEPGQRRGKRCKSLGPWLQYFKVGEIR